MTVYELRKRLVEFPPDMAVMTNDSDYGEQEVTEFTVVWTDGIHEESTREELERVRVHFPLGGQGEIRQVLFLR